MDYYNFRPQWRQWNYSHCQKPACSRCGLTHPWNYCAARTKVCYRCHKVGHYSRMCHSNVKITTEFQKPSKSEKQKLRDNARLATYFERKQSLRELPFANLRKETFKNCVENNFNLKSEVVSMKTKLSKINSDLQRANEKIIELEQKLLTNDKRNQDLQQELQTSREKQSQTEISSNDKMQQLINENKKLKEEVESGDRFLKWYSETYDTRVTEHLQALKEEQEKTEKEKTEKENLQKELQMLKSRQNSGNVNNSAIAQEQISPPFRQPRNVYYHHNRHPQNRRHNDRGRGRF